jgi:hypothetical protein
MLPAFRPQHTIAETATPSMQVGHKKREGKHWRQANSPAQVSRGKASGLSVVLECVLTALSGEEPAFMQHEPHAGQFGLEEARRVLGDVFAPWVQDLKLSIEGIDYGPDVLVDVGSHRPGHELRPGHAFERYRQQAGGDGVERLCDAVRTRCQLQRIVNQS